MKKDRFLIANKYFSSRLIVGTGKYKNMQECAKAIKLSGADIVTVAVRRVNIIDKKRPLLMDYIDPKKLPTFQIQQDVLHLKKPLELLDWLERLEVGN